MSAIIDFMDCVLAMGSKDPEKQCSAQMQYKAATNFACAVLFMFTVVVINCFTRGELSVALTIGAAAQCFGFFLLSQKVKLQKSVAGLSARTFEMYVLFFICRLSSTCVKNGYLPIDRSGDHIYQIVDLCSLMLVLDLVYSVRTRYNVTYQPEFDTLQIHKAVPALVVLSIFVKGSLNGHQFFDFIWMLSSYLETIALAPQLWMLSKLGGRVESMTSHFVASQVLSRSLAFFFWAQGYTEISKVKRDSPVGYNVAGHAVLVAHVLQLILCADFMYYYGKGLCSGKGKGGVVLPTMSMSI